MTEPDISFLEIKHIPIEDAFKLRPSKWHDWVNPFWWIRAKKLHRLMRFFMKKNNFDKQFSQAIEDSLLHGTGIIKIKNEAYEP